MTCVYGMSFLTNAINHYKHVKYSALPDYKSYSHVFGTFFLSTMKKDEVKASCFINPGIKAG